ncbi:MAG: alpha-L-glutamate ligase-like protein [Gammaproteobacteria bacterium]|nr:alpha-L-glutamate ligase-like protein [Gammaproteobacteria bacterium]MCP5140045.1 alpha-L-glutamate ligase-like protein [Chromatiales bacterium]
MFGLAKRLSASGVLGINARNCRYILRHNPRHLYPLVDDKLATKRLAIAAGLPVPELYGVITSHHDVRRLPELVAGHRDFVIKPAHGSGGDGILVVSARVRDGSAYRLVDGTIMDGDDIGHHLSNMLSGQYSLGGHRDIALIEYCVKFDPIFSECAYRGIPDIRVIVFRGYPVMAMLRLPTRRSHGKANLHQGAVGAGLDLATGKTICAVIGNSVVTEHPDTGAVIAGRQIPRWEYLLDFAARCHELTGLGYLGVDIVLDRDLGPMLLELNVRPGLNIQIANRCGLGDRLRAIEARPAGVGVKERVAFSMGPLLQPAAVAI